MHTTNNTYPTNKTITKSPATTKKEENRANETEDSNKVEQIQQLNKKHPRIQTCNTKSKHDQKHTITN